MSVESVFPDGLGLIETLRWRRGEGFWLLREHLARLETSAKALGIACDIDRVDAKLQLTAAKASEPLLRVRLLLAGDGSIEVSATPIVPVAQDTIWRVVPALESLDSGDPLLRHKTTRRAVYENAFAAAARHGADEALFLNERGEVCEGARCSVFLKTGDLLLTPPLSCGLLAGVLRGRLLRDGRTREAVLFPHDFRHDAQWYMGNSVRGLVRCRLQGLHTRSR